MIKKNNTHHIVPKRAFGNTGVEISKLCLGGGSFTGTDCQALLDEALKYGVNCWEIVSFITRDVCPFGKPAMTDAAPVCYSCDHFTQPRRMIDDNTGNSFPNKGFNTGRSSIKVCSLAREEAEP